jgi:hypothetical protein
MRCEECNTDIDEGHTYERSDFNMFTRKPMMMLWYVCSNENCGVNLPVEVE